MLCSRVCVHEEAVQASSIVVLPSPHSSCGIRASTIPSLASEMLYKLMHCLVPSCAAATHCAKNTAKVKDAAFFLKSRHTCFVSTRVPFPHATPCPASCNKHDKESRRDALPYMHVMNCGNKLAQHYSSREVLAVHDELAARIPCAPCRARLSCAAVHEQGKPPLCGSSPRAAICGHVSLGCSYLPGCNVHTKCWHQSLSANLSDAKLRAAFIIIMHAQRLSLYPILSCPSSTRCIPFIQIDVVKEA